MRRNPLHKDALRRAHDKISRLIAEAAEPETKRHVVWDNRASARGDEEEDVWEMWLDDEISQVSFLDDRYDAFVVTDLNGTGRNGRRRCEVFNSMREVFNFAAKVDFYLVYV